MMIELLFTPIVFGIVLVWSYIVNRKIEKTSKRWDEIFKKLDKNVQDVKLEMDKRIVYYNKELEKLENSLK